MKFYGPGGVPTQPLNLQQVWDALVRTNWMFTQAKGHELHWVRGPLACVIRIDTDESLINRDLSTVSVVLTKWVNVGVDSLGNVWVHRNEVEGFYA